MQEGWGTVILDIFKDGDNVLKDCLEIFRKEMEREKINNPSRDADCLILDRYIPADGDYIVVKQNGEPIQSLIKLDKKSRKIEDIPPNFDDLCFYDYHCRLVSMDKPQDPKKVIHSNSYLSFWVKQESLTNGKLDEAAIDRYFDILKDPRKKYSKPKDREMYDYILEKVGEVDQEKLEKNRSWIKEHIFQLDQDGVKLSGKNYLKIFFEDDRELYIKEEQRYLMTKIFNKNDYNVEIDGTIFGLPNDNLGLNAKKPYLENKTQKTGVPYLISSEEAVQQRKFFDYLMNNANAGKTNLFFDSKKNRIIAKENGKMVNDDFFGYFLQIEKGKEIIIQHQDVIVDYRYLLRKTFQYKNVLQVEDKEEFYKEYRNKGELWRIINNVFFLKKLIQNPFASEESLSVEGELKRNLVWAREEIFSWLYKGKQEGIDRILQQVCWNMTKASILNDHMEKARKQFNLMCSFQEYFAGGKDMASNYGEIREKLKTKINRWEMSNIKSDEEYFYAVGQLVNYFISLNRSKDKPHALANPFFNAKSDKWIKEKLKQFFMKYNYCLKFSGLRFNQLYTMITHYEVKGEIQQDTIVAGYISPSLVYEVSEKGQEEE